MWWVAIKIPQVIEKQNLDSVAEGDAYGPEREMDDNSYDLAKVRVAGSNPVFRSRCGCNSVGRVSGLGKEPVTLSGMRVKDKVSMTLLRWFESIHLHIPCKGIRSPSEKKCLGIRLFGSNGSG